MKTWKSKKNHLLILAENQRIETPRLWLRPVTMADANDLFEYASDEETTEFVFPEASITCGYKKSPLQRIFSGAIR